MKKDYLILFIITSRVVSFLPCRYMTHSKTDSLNRSGCYLMNNLYRGNLSYTEQHFRRSSFTCPVASSLPKKCSFLFCSLSSHLSASIALSSIGKSCSQGRFRYHSCWITASICSGPSWWLGYFLSRNVFIEIPGAWCKCTFFWCFRYRLGRDDMVVMMASWWEFGGRKEVSSRHFRVAAVRLHGYDYVK